MAIPLVAPTAPAPAATPAGPRLRVVDGEAERPRTWGGKQVDTDASDAVVAELAAGPDADREKALRKRLVVLWMPLATSIAMRYRARGESLDDLTQAACLGLVKAANGFRPEVGASFEAYAAVTVTGEVRRHFRDHGWDLRPPRRIQELRAKVAEAQDTLGAELGRSPRMSEVAEHLGVDVDDVAECIASVDSYRLRSIDATVTETGAPLADVLGDEDPDMARVVDAMALAAAIEQLPERTRLLLRLRFVDELTQQEIGDRIGVTQMQVSRLLTKAYTTLRVALRDEPVPAGT